MESPECELNSRFQELRQALSDSACSVRGSAINSIVAPSLPSPLDTLGKSAATQAVLWKGTCNEELRPPTSSHVSEPHGDGPSSPSQDLRWLACHPHPPTSWQQHKPQFSKGMGPAPYWQCSVPPKFTLIPNLIVFGSEGEAIRSLGREGRALIVGLVPL